MSSAIQNLAWEIAALSNRDLDALARELVRVFTPRAEQLEHMIAMHSQEQISQLHKQLGITDNS